MQSLNTNEKGVVQAVPTVRADFYSEAPGVAAAKFAVMAWLEKNPQASRYIRKLRSDNSYAGPRALFRVFKWLVKQPGWVPENGVGDVQFVLDKQSRMQNDHERAELENLLLDFINGEINGTKNYKLKFYNTFHGLFKYHRIQLPNSDISEIKADTAPVQGNLSLDEIRRVIEACKPRERAIFTLIFQGIMDEERFTIVNKNWPVIEAQLKDGREWIIFRFEYRKRNDHPYFTMWHCDSDAIRFMKDYLRERGTPRMINTDNRGQPVYEALFLNREKKPFNKDNLKQAWLEAGTRAGVVQRPRPVCKKCGLLMRKSRKYRPGEQGGVKRYECICGNIEPAAQYYQQFSKFRSGKNLHEVRDTLKTMLPNLAGVDRTLVAFFAGHQIDPLDYEKLRDAEKYGLMGEIQDKWRKALPHLNLWSQPANTPMSTRKVADLEAQLKEMWAKREEDSEALQKVRSDMIEMMEGRLADQSTMLELQNKMRQTLDNLDAVLKGADPKSPAEFAELRARLQARGVLPPDPLLVKP